MRTGIATVPLDWGKCPPWLFERMKRLAQGITSAIVEEYGAQEMIKRLSDPIWFQSLGCVMGFDWNSSGLTTTTMGALKEALRGSERDFGIFICGGKKVSQKTPHETMYWGEMLGFSEDQVKRLVYASRAAAKVDSSLIQDGFQIYTHNLIFTKSGEWTVVQQGMNTQYRKARRYHWHFSRVRDFCEDPHTGIASDFRANPLNLTASQSFQNKTLSCDFVRDDPKNFLKDLKLLGEKSDGLMRQKRLFNFAEMELNNVEFHWHPVVSEKFNIKRLKKTIEKAHFLAPENFENLMMGKGIGPKTIRALSLVAEIVYGAKPSYQDPARYSFGVGGKDRTPYPVDRETYDKTLEIIEKGIKQSKINLREMDKAKARLETIAYPF